MNLEKVIDFLKKIREHDADQFQYQKISDCLKELKAESLRNNDQEKAKQIWIYEQTGKAQHLYLQAYKELKNERYFSAWCDLEQCELAIKFLVRHYSIQQRDPYYLDFIREYVRKYQSIFPYKLFLSPEMVYLEKKCNICGNIVTIRKPCAHEVGEIYNGEMCCREITKVDVIGMSFVEDPAHKYSVAFAADSKNNKRIDQYNYAALRFLISHIQFPFQPWDVKFTKRTYNKAKLNKIEADILCPCGSGKLYRDCCISQDEITIPHMEFVLLSPT